MYVNSLKMTSDTDATISLKTFYEEIQQIIR